MSNHRFHASADSTRRPPHGKLDLAADRSALEKTNDGREAAVLGLLFAIQTFDYRPTGVCGKLHLHNQTIYLIERVDPMIEINAYDRDGMCVWNGMIDCRENPIRRDAIVNEVLNLLS